MNKIIARVAVLFLILVLLGSSGALAAPAFGTAASRAAALAEAPDQYSWTLETVAERAGRSPALALDALGRPRIACIGYYDEHTYGLLYLRYENFTWHSELVDDSGSDHVSLALDAAGEPHISYYGAADADLLYAHYYGGSWHIQHVDTISDTGKYTSIQVDSAGMPHIAFWDQSDEAVRYTRRVGANWQTETIAVVGGYGDDISLVLDAQDHPHVTYHDDALRALRYAYHDGAAWNIETVDDEEWYTGERNSLALDAQGHPHVAYSASGMRYAWHDGTSWHITILEDDHLAGDSISLALNSLGRPHISSVTWHYPAEHWVRHDYLDGFDWQIETVEVSTATFGYDGTSLALDPADRIHIAYGDPGAEPELLRHAFYGEPCTPVDGASAAGPARIPSGVEGAYTAAYTPANASTPVLYAWDNGAAGATAAYTWALTGSYTVTVTATNACGQAQGMLAVEVFCQPLAGVEVNGPHALLAGQAGTFRAAVEPITASLPLTVTWDNGSSGPTAFYSWTTTGTYTLTLTATNPCGAERGAFFQVHVLAEWPYAVYLPLLRR